MSKRPQPQYSNFLRFRKAVDDHNVITVGTLLILGVVTGIIIAGATLGHRAVAGYTAADQHYAQVFNEQPDRQTFARQLLTAHNSGLLGKQDVFDVNPDYLKEMQHVAASDDKFSLPPEQPRSWSSIWTLSAIIFSGWLLLASTFFGLYYCAHAADNKHYLADLPWKRRAWPWVLAALSPVLWIPLLVSRNNIRRADKQLLTGVGIAQ